MALETKQSPRHVRDRQKLEFRLDPKGLSRQGLALLLGAAFARAAVTEGMQPFGVAYVAAAGHPLAREPGSAGRTFSRSVRPTNSSTVRTPSFAIYSRSS